MRISTIIENGKTYEKYTYYDDSSRIQIEKYYFNYRLHRENGPAMINYDKFGKVQWECFMINNYYHREDGPAIIYYLNEEIIDRSYYIHDKLITDDLQKMIIEGNKI